MGVLQESIKTSIGPKGVGSDSARSERLSFLGRLLRRPELPLSTSVRRPLHRRAPELLFRMPQQFRPSPGCAESGSPLQKGRALIFCWQEP